MSNEAQQQAWQRLDDVASTHRRELFPEVKDWEKQRLRLHQAAVAYAATCKSSKPNPGRVVGTNGRELRGGVSPTFGSSKGVPLEEIETKDLRWYEKVTLEQIDDPDKRNFIAKNRAFLTAVRKELATR